MKAPSVPSKYKNSLLAIQRAMKTGKWSRIKLKGLGPILRRLAPAGALNAPMTPSYKQLIEAVEEFRLREHIKKGTLKQQWNKFKKHLQGNAANVYYGQRYYAQLLEAEMKKRKLLKPPISQPPRRSNDSNKTVQCKDWVYRITSDNRTYYLNDPSTTNPQVTIVNFNLKGKNVFYDGLVMLREKVQNLRPLKSFVVEYLLKVANEDYKATLSLLKKQPKIKEMLRNAMDFGIINSGTLQTVVDLDRCVSQAASPLKWFIVLNWKQWTDKELGWTQISDECSDRLGEKSYKPSTIKKICHRMGLNCKPHTAKQDKFFSRFAKVYHAAKAFQDAREERRLEEQST